jgi:hypothetical protein
VSSTAAGPLAGSVRWAVVPFAPAPPFRLYAGPESEPIIVPDADTVINAAIKGGDAQLSYIVAGKARPVLLLNDPPSAHHREVTGLRLLRLAKLSPDEQERVRAQQEELLFHLPPERFQLPPRRSAASTTTKCACSENGSSGSTASMSVFSSSDRSASLRNDTLDGPHASGRTAPSEASTYLAERAYGSVRSRDWMPKSPRMSRFAPPRPTSASS